MGGKICNHLRSMADKNTVVQNRIFQKVKIINLLFSNEM